MPTINVQADLTVDALLSAAEQLDEQDLRRFTSRLLALQARRSAGSLGADESELLKTAGATPPAAIQTRYDQLIAKRDAEALTNAEYRELLDLTKQVEAFDTARVEALTNLAALRGVSLAELMDDLHFEPVGHG